MTKIYHSICKYCEKKFVGIRSKSHKPPIFCSRSCSSKDRVKNRKIKQKMLKYVCLNCEKTFEKPERSKPFLFCNRKCRADFEAKSISKRIEDLRQQGILI